MVDERTVFEDRADAGRRLEAELQGYVRVDEALVVAPSRGGREVADALVEPGQEVRGVDTLAAIAELPDACGRVVLLVDDGERPAEELGAAAWALKWIRPERIVVVTPVASRWLEAALPP